MAGKKDYCVVSVTSGLTKSQATGLVGAIAKEKNKIAPLGRSTAAVTTSGGVGRLLQRGVKQISNK